MFLKKPYLIGIAFHFDMWCVVLVCNVCVHYVRMCTGKCVSVFVVTGGWWHWVAHLSEICASSMRQGLLWSEGNQLGWIHWPLSLRNPVFAFQACTPMCSIFTRVQQISSDPHAWKANTLPREPSLVTYEQEEIKEEIINKLKNKEG